MVRDNVPPRRKHIRRRSSWKDTMRGASESDRQKTPQFPLAASASSHFLRVPSKSAPSRSASSSSPSKPSTPFEELGTLGDAESDSDDGDYDYAKRSASLRVEDRPIAARILYKYPSDGSDTLLGNDEDKDKRAFETQQHQLELALAEADGKAATMNKDAAAANGRTKEPIGTRLTMTSRVGYFQDRIISPSMVRT